MNVTQEDRDVAHQYAHCFSGDGIEMAEELAKDFAAHRERGYLRGVEDAAKVANKAIKDYAFTEGHQSPGDYAAIACITIRALGAKHMTELRPAIEVANDILLGGDKDVICEKIVVNDIARVDAYEGYSHSYPEESLYVREPHLDGWIYRYNQKLSFANRIIRSGDYLLYTQTKRGINAGKFSNN